MKDTYKSISWYKDKEQLLTKYNYTCLNENNECEKCQSNCLQCMNLYGGKGKMKKEAQKVVNDICKIAYNDLKKYLEE